MLNTRIIIKKNKFNFNKSKLKNNNKIIIKLIKNKNHLPVNIAIMLIKQKKIF